MVGQKQRKGQVQLQLEAMKKKKKKTGGGWLLILEEDSCNYGWEWWGQVQTSTALTSGCGIACCPCTAYA